ncbi:MAG: glycosyl transferase family 1 [Thermotoga sp.]|nr:MAG: glycosyl transferase family 1 [Thermotoga sp.]
MRSIGICHYKVGGTDGVSLEIDKWKKVLEKMGYEVYLCAGSSGSEEGFLIEELYHHREDIERISKNAFFKFIDYANEIEFKEEIYELAKKIENALKSFIKKRSIDLIIVDNIWSIGANLPAAVALTEVVKDLGIPAIGHHHDFYWERVNNNAPTCGAAEGIIEHFLPPKNPLIKHVVINSLAQKELFTRKGIESIIVPNVFEFDGASWTQDEYNEDFRKAIGIKEKDIIVLQATRVVKRKGIELAIDFVKEVSRPKYTEKIKKKGLYNGKEFDDDSKIVLVMAGYSEDKTESYLNLLKKKVKEEGIEARYISDIIGASRGLRNGKKIYSLWDTYIFADLVTYPSLHEGWGNQFLEAIRARLPIVLFEYDVYKSDIKERGFDVISLGDKIMGRDGRGLVKIKHESLVESACRAVDYLTNAHLRAKMVEHNFDLGRRYYSLQALEDYLREIFSTH